MSSIAEVLVWNLKTRAEFVRSPMTMLKTPYYSGGNQLLQNSLVIRYLYDRGRKMFHLLAGEV